MTAKTTSFPQDMQLPPKTNHVPFGGVLTTDSGPDWFSKTHRKNSNSGPLWKHRRVTNADCMVFWQTDCFQQLLNFPLLRDVLISCYQEADCTIRFRSLIFFSWVPKEQQTTKPERTWHFITHWKDELSWESSFKWNCLEWLHKALYFRVYFKEL